MAVHLPLSQQTLQAIILLLKKKKYTKKKCLVLTVFVSALITVAVKSDAKRRKETKKKYKTLSRRSSVIKLKDGSRQILVPYRDGITKVSIVATPQDVFDSHKNLFLGPDGLPAVIQGNKINIDKNFFKQFSALWSIMVPGVTSKVSLLLFSNTIFLILRTYLSLTVARLDGSIVKDLVSGNGKGFLKGILYWILIGIPASYTNSVIKFFQSKISIAFRTALTRYIHDLYVNKNIAYYKATNLDGSIKEMDQYITTDLAVFCDGVASLYSNMGKPFMDLLFFNYQLAKSLDTTALLFILSSYFTTAWVLKKVSPPFGKLKALEAKYEGDFRKAQSQIITNSEEIAFYEGADLEKEITTKIFLRLIDHINTIYKIKIGYNMFEDYILKYLWSALGYLIISFPIFLRIKKINPGNISTTLSKAELASVEQLRMKSFIVNKRLMLSLADAGVRMMHSIKDLSELAGYTSRVFDLVATLHRINANAYYGVNSAEPISNTAVLTLNEKSIPPTITTRFRLSSLAKGPRYYVEPFSLPDVQGMRFQSYNGIRFEDVPIIAPASRWNLSGELLIEPLNFAVKHNDHLLISGPNGIGKSSLARILAGIWPVYRGLVSKPTASDIFFLPQRPYFSVGNLRDQIIYPDTYDDMVDSGRNDNELMDILKLVKLEYLPGREGGWETKKEWKDVFSGGEKQRIGFARLLYHEPRFAVIDEGTSAVSSDIEGVLYETCKEQDMTLITISNRPSLMKYHKILLKLGTGDEATGWSFDIYDSQHEWKSVEKEIKDLKSQIEKSNEWKARLEEIDQQLLEESSPES